MKIRKFARQHPHKVIKTVDQEIDQLTKLKEKIAIVLPIITDNRSFIVDYLKLYATISVTLNGGAIVAILSTSLDKYCDALPYFAVCLFILMCTILIVFLLHTFPVSHFTKFLFSNDSNIKFLIDRIKFDSQIASMIMFLSILASVYFFSIGSSIGINTSIN